MLDRLKNFVPQRWWFALIAVGLVIGVAAVAAANYDVALIGLGMRAGGFGEWINHGIETDFAKWRDANVTPPRQPTHRGRA